MKNKTIEILNQDKCKLPSGTKVKAFKDGKLSGEWVANDADGDYGTEYGYIYEVDFSDLPPLYPTKGMEVPAEGIEFADNDGKLLDVGEHGAGWITGEGKKHYDNWEYISGENEYDRATFKLKRTLPKTITVCAECFKETCECKHDTGWYRVKRCGCWGLMRWNGTDWVTHLGGGTMGNINSYPNVDWDNRIEVEPTNYK